VKLTIRYLYCAPYSALPWDIFIEPFIGKNYHEISSLCPLLHLTVIYLHYAPYSNISWDIYIMPTVVKLAIKYLHCAPYSALPWDIFIVPLTSLCPLKCLTMRYLHWAPYFIVSLKVPYHEISSFALYSALPWDIFIVPPIVPLGLPLLVVHDANSSDVVN